MKDIQQVIRNGTTQDSRFLAALDFNYVKIDERTLEDLVVFTLGLSKLINFYNINNQIEGDWSDFLNDELVILCTIIDAEPNKIETKLKNHLEKANLFLNPAKKTTYLKNCFEDIYGIAAKFDTWLVKLKYIEEFSSTQLSIRTEIANAISTKLSLALSKLEWYQKRFEDKYKEKITIQYNDFDVFWHKESLPEANIIEREGEIDNLKDYVAFVTEGLEQIFQSFYETLLYLKQKAPDYLKQSLRNDAHHPQVSLLIAFFKLFKISQDNLNDFSKRYLEFYYAQVLRQQIKPAIHDKVYIKFLLDENTFLVKIPQNTLFLAGEDKKGNDILYQADQDMLFNKAQIQKLYTTFIDQTSLNIKGIDKKLITNILSAEIPTNPANFILENYKQTTYATFGESQSYKGSHEKTMQDASIGFAIASPSFILSEGDRDISLSFEFSSSSVPFLEEMIEDIGFITQNSTIEVFVKSFLDAFTLHVTTPQGWYTIKRYVSAWKKEENTIKIQFSLGSEEPAFTNYDATIHEGNYNSSLPLVRFMLNSHSYIYGYSLLNKLILEKILIETDVKGVKDLLLYNQIGQLSADSPFHPFGPMPHLGSYLIIGKNEIFQKSLEKLAINVEWFDLPKQNSGFFGYYQDYNLPIDNTSFEVKLSILDGGRWKPDDLAEQQTFKLFRTLDVHLEEPKPAVALKPSTSFDHINISPIKLPANYPAIQETYNYSNTLQRGFIKLELNNPPFAFAHTIYPSILSENVIQKTATSFFKSFKTAFQKKKNKPSLPNPPYAPQIKMLSLDYTSSSVISLKDRAKKSDNTDYRGQFFHIHPFGETLVYPDNSKQFTPFIPDFSYEGCLLIGLKELSPPQNITLLFEMVDEYTVSSEDDPPVVEWSYLANDEWHILAPSKILKDNTNGFIKTGIIVIELPFEMQMGNSILDKDLFWLRASVVSNIEGASKIISVHTQVLTATLVENENLDKAYLTKPLAPFSIERSVNNIPGVQRVIQPLASFSGFPLEKSTEFYIRIAERLRHKQRVLTAWDHERLILEKFPAVAKVTCLNNMTSRKLDAPGYVLLVVTPRDTDSIEPKASSELLYQIKSYIQKYASPFVKIEVRNPNYERIKIIGTVKFTDGYNYGFYIQKLNEQINDYLIGNLLSNNKMVELGGKIYISDILSFMRTLPYVDFITKFSIIQAAQDLSGKYILIDTAREGEAKSFLQATKPWSALVPAEEHQITVIGDKQELKPNQAGIDYLSLGYDFIIE